MAFFVFRFQAFLVLITALWYSALISPQIVWHFAKQPVNFI